MVDIARFLAQRPDPRPASDVSAELARHIQSLLRDLLPASKRMSGTLAVGSIAGERGQSLRIHVRGPKRGRWADFATGECGDALDLVAAVLFNGDLRRAYGWALNWLGIDMVRARRNPKRRQAAQQRDDGEQAEHAKVIAVAAAAWAETVAAPGTLTDLYLADRHIRGAIPSSIRHHSALPYWHEGTLIGCFPALVAKVENPATGEFLGVHRVYLNSAIDPGPARKLGLTYNGQALEAKKTRGPTRGGGVVFGPLRGRGPTYVGEGIETVLSAVWLESWPGIAALGAWNLPLVQLPPHVRDVVIVPDPDPGGLQGARHAAERWTAESRRVRIAGATRSADAA